MGLAGFLGLCLIIGVGAADITDVDARAWYLSLARPAGAPPGWLFGLAWEALYVPMGIAAWLVWRHPDGRRRHDALTIWGWQLTLNAVWAPVFFGLHQKLGALAVSVAIFALLAWTLLRFRRLDGKAGVLLLPSLAWAGFIVYLAAGFCWLNG